MALINVRVRVNSPMVSVVSTVLCEWIVAAGAAGKGGWFILKNLSRID